MFKRLLVAVCLSVFWIGCSAQTGEGEHDVVQTVAGQLTITRLFHVGSDLATFKLQLAGRDFKKLYGERYTYYTDSGSSDKSRGRMVVEDFIGGASDAPVIMLYDFRGQSPVADQITDRLDVDDVRWRSDGVLLRANGMRYIYRRGRLSRFLSKAN